MNVNPDLGKTLRAFGSPSFSKQLDISSPLARSRRQSVEQHLGLFQIAHVKPLGEPAVDRSEKIASLVPFVLIAPKRPNFLLRRSELPQYPRIRSPKMTQFSPSKRVR